MEKLIGKHAKVFMDSAEPRSIEYFRKQGFNTVACKKGPNSVEARIRFL
jgi:phage terminase large subunit